MNKQACNPYLPGYEYVPDAEPHVFGERVYIYGSHDAFNGKRYCQNDYACYSAPVTDLGDWTYEGVIYRRKQDPVKGLLKTMWAPDAIKGFDGRYYLYYSLSWYPAISVAVCDTPCGKFEYYGKVKYQDGTIYGKKEGDNIFDPAVIITGGQLYLYSGYSPDEKQAKLIAFFNGVKYCNMGSQVLTLCEDMLTVKVNPKPLIPGRGNSRGTGFEGHEFYEGSSIRKFGDLYYAIWSSVRSHELCYATSKYPDKEFEYRGTLVSNGDIGLAGITESNPQNYIGNIHGSIEIINGKYYVFYHRQTNHTEQSRQGCAEEIEIDADGSIKQAEMTSQGLRGKPYTNHGEYYAYIACNLMSGSGALKCSYGFGSKYKYRKHPCFSQDKKDGAECDQYIKGMRDRSVAGFKYFYIDCISSVSVTIRGNGGKLLISSKLGADPFCSINISSAKTWTKYSVRLKKSFKNEKATPLYFTYHGNGKIDFLSFELQ